MNVAIKTEPGSPGPPTMPPCDIIHKPKVNIKIEPGSPPTMLHSDFSGVDIKVEPSSPPTTLAIDPLIIDIKEPFELPVPLFRIVSVTTLKRSSNTSGGKDSLGSNKRVSVGPTRSSQKKSGSNEGASNECDVCGRRFANKNYVRQHLLTHKGKKSHSCFVCGRGFNYKITLRRHEETHCVKAYTCLVCDQKFAEESNFVEHQLAHMSAEMYRCRMCASKFCTREALERHERVHASGADMCVCEECGMTFEQTAALERHLKLHVMKKPQPATFTKTKKPYLCHLCPAAFAKPRNLEKHVVMHVARKRQQCPVCWKTYCGYSNLVRHIHLMHSRVCTTVANTDGSVKILRYPSTTSPPDDASTNEKGPAGVAFGESTSAKPCATSSETSIGIMDSNPG